MPQTDGRKQDLTHTSYCVGQIKQNSCEQQNERCSKSARENL